VKLVLVQNWNIYSLTYHTDHRANNKDSGVNPY